MKTSQFKTVNEWLDYLESLHPENIELGLERIRVVADSLSVSKPAGFVFTVAGTNGKGSTVAFLNEFCRAANLKTGSYTSPHFHIYNERIQINGQQVTDQDLIDSFEAVEKARGEVQLTYFEFGTLSAFWLFKKHQVDVAVLEIGLGGRLDAVNIVDPDVAIITSIGLDHQSWLGSDLEKIGYEKAGIFRSGVPAVVGQRSPQKSILDFANEIEAPLFIKGQEFDFEEFHENWNWFGQAIANNSTMASTNNGDSQSALQTSDKVKSAQMEWSGGMERSSLVELTSSVIGKLPVTNLPLENAATAIQAIKVSGLEPLLNLSDDEIKLSVSNARVPGRFQIINKDERTYILDVAHNPQAANYLASRIEKIQSQNQFDRVIAVVSFLEDKDAKGAVAPVLNIVDRWLVCGLDQYRGLSTAQLADKLGVTKEFSADLEQFDAREGLLSGKNKFILAKSVHSALSFLKSEASSKDLILVFGSFFTVAEAQAWLDASF